MLNRFKLLIVGICLVPSLTLANFTLSPVKLVINKDEKVTALTLSNNSDKPRSFQLTAFKIEHKDGKEIDVPTKDIIVTPLSFKLAPSKVQTIRVAIKNEGDYKIDERVYRVSVKELPHKLNAEGAQVQLVTEFRVPVGITDKKIDGGLEE
jgi:fimbrial chaperone protein